MTTGSSSVAGDRQLRRGRPSAGRRAARGRGTSRGPVSPIATQRGWRRAALGSPRRSPRTSRPRSAGAVRPSCRRRGGRRPAPRPRPSPARDEPIVMNRRTPAARARASTSAGSSLQLVTCVWVSITQSGSSTRGNSGPSSLRRRACGKQAGRGVVPAHVAAVGADGREDRVGRASGMNAAIMTAITRRPSCSVYEDVVELARPRPGPSRASTARAPRRSG